MSRVSAQQDSPRLPPAAIQVPSGRSRAAAFLEENGTLVMVLGAFAIVLLTTLRTGLATDGWMALLSGREIVRHGLPSHDTLALWTHGRRWTDQQWLSQLALYGLWRLGGLKLALLVHAALAAGALAGAAALAGRFGASARSATWIAVPALVCYYPAAAVMRPQSLAYPLFVAVLWLLVADTRRPSRQVFLVLPLLVLWGNLHGSCLLGAALVALAGAVRLWESMRGKRRLSQRGVVLLVLPWLCLLASPYALHLPAYYKKVTIGGGFSAFVTEWAPTTLTLVTVPFFLLVLLGIWLLGRTGAASTSFEKLAFLASAVVGFQAVRNLAWFALVAVALLPSLLDRARRPPEEPRRLNRMLATVVLAGVVVAVAGVATNDDGWFLEDFPPQAAAAVSTAAGPDGHVLATSSYADWLLWTRPELRGRVAYDARFELMTKGELRTAQEFQARVEGWQQLAQRYRVIVIDRNDDAKLLRGLIRLGLAHVVRADGDVVVLRGNR